jgi:hypothetical protein
MINRSFKIVLIFIMLSKNHYLNVSLFSQQHYKFKNNDKNNQKGGEKSVKYNNCNNCNKRMFKN